MCLNETYSKVPVGKHLSHIFPTKNGLKQADALSPLLSTLLSVHHYEGSDKPVDLKLNGTQQLLVYTNDVNTLHRSLHMIQKNTETLVVRRLDLM